MKYNLDRFVIAQEKNYANALEEIKNGKKISHWMWFIFPQLKYLGTSPTSLFYGINDLEEAKEYLHHEILGRRLLEITRELLKLPNKDANQIFGLIDAMKLKSCMTLFSHTNPSVIEFKQVLEKYFEGKEDEHTLRLMQ